mgnify:CR=1 FL=1
MKFNTPKEQEESTKRILELSAVEISKLIYSVNNLLNGPTVKVQILNVYYNPVEEIYELFGAFTIYGELFWARSTSDRITDPDLADNFYKEIAACIRAKNKWSHDYKFDDCCVKTGEQIDPWQGLVVRGNQAVPEFVPEPWHVEQLAQEEPALVNNGGDDQVVNNNADLPLQDHAMPEFPAARRLLNRAMNYLRGDAAGARVHDDAYYNLDIQDIMERQYEAYRNRQAEARIDAGNQVAQGPNNHALDAADHVRGQAIQDPRVGNFMDIPLGRLGEHAERIRMERGERPNIEALQRF